MMTAIYGLSFEVDGDAINLEQDTGCGEVDRVTLHPIHLRLLAEQAGILAPSSNIEADRTIARLCRQLRTLFERIDYLDDCLNREAQRGHADLEAETIYSFATWELANEFIKDLPQPATAPTANTHGTGVIAAGNDPKSGAVALSNPPKSGAVAGRVQRHRARRAAMLEALRGKGLTPALNMPAKALHELFTEHCNGGNSVTRASVTGQPATASLL
jgi:hypothetical protein